ncbi:MAG: DUF1566 domain-containing protein [Flavobacteriaceae bacterium]
MKSILVLILALFFFVICRAQVGIGTTNPQEQLDVNGALKIGTTTSSNPGTIRWTGTDFEGYNGTLWNSLTSKLIKIDDLVDAKSDANGSSVFLGVNSGSNDAGNNDNSAVGNSSLFKNNSGNYNSAFGKNSLYNNEGGSENVGIGDFSGFSNVSGNKNIFIGNEAGYYETGSDKLYIENTSSNEINSLIYGEFDNDMLRVNGELQIGNPAGLGYKLPISRGTNNQGLITDGNGNLYWSTFSNEHYIGEIYGGGIVFYVYNNGQNGLIASLNDLDGGNGIQWYNGSNIVTNATNPYEGVSNTSTIVGLQGGGSYAAKICDDYTAGGYSDWYLPSNLELKEIDNAIMTIYNVLANDGDPQTNPINPEYLAPTYGRYWSSTEIASTSAFSYLFYSGVNNFELKNATYRVRAIRKF